MQKTIRLLRVVLPIAFFAFIALLVASFRRPEPMKQKVADPIKVTRHGEKPQLESKGFEDTQTIGGRVASRIRAERLVSYNSGWNTLENVHLTIYRVSGLTYELVCSSAQFNAKTKEADAKGGVKVTSSDGVEINTAEIHFDGNRLTNHIPVQFRIDRWRGTAGALDLDVQGETLRLWEKLDATMLPQRPEESAMNLKAAQGIFRRRLNEVEFTEKVVMTHDADQLEGDKMVGRFTADRKALVGFEGIGNVIVRMASNPSAAGGVAGASDLGGRKEITCDRFWSEVTAGEISAINAVGEQRPAHAILDGPPKRDIVARAFRVALANKAVTDLAAADNVVMKELGDAPREVRGDRVTVYFDAASHRAANAIIDGSFRYSDPKNSATAVRANYDIVNDRIVLTAQLGFDPTVISDGQTLKAKTIEFSPKAGSAKATGEVIAQLISKKESVSADGTGVFPASKPVFVNSDVVTMRQGTKTAVFSGNVRAWQETNTLFAQEMQVQGAGDQITARGNVRATLYNASSPGEPARKTPVLSRSDQLFARKNERRIDLLGNVKIDDDQRHVTSEKATFLFDAARKIERIDAETKVVLIDQAAQRKGTGDKVTYLVGKKMIYVTGAPATVTAPNGNVSSQQISIDLARNKVEAMSSTAATQGTYKQTQ
jgi:lipopolysaccharide export system protein LptA